MTRFLFAVPFTIGAVAVLAIAYTFPGNSVALAVTLIIAVAYSMGFLELLRFRRNTASLDRQLDDLPASRDALRHWLQALPAPLRHSVQRRVEGHPAPLPGPVLTPYLTGLLVMLGLLGTFIGMIVTLQGAATALDGSSELTAIRSALSAPIAGLSLAFGTSIAGVAASAMLGLTATLCRRDRLLVARRLDSLSDTALHVYSLDYQRETAYRALHQQAEAFPALVEALQGLTGRMEQLGSELRDSLTDNQRNFHASVQAEYRQLAESVGQSLDTSLADCSRLALENLQPLMRQSLASISEQVEGTHRRLAELSEQQLGTLSREFRETTVSAADHWRAGLEAQQESSSRLAGDICNSLSAYNDRFTANSETLLDNQRLGLDSLVAGIREELTSLRDAEAERGAAASDRLAALEGTVGEHLGRLGSALEAPMTRLIETAAETPQAAAEVIRRLNEEMTRSSERDNQLLEERRRILQELDSLLGNQRETAGAQHAAIETLVARASETLGQVGETFSREVAAQSERLNEVAGDVSGSAAEVSSLSDAFAAAVQVFSDSNEKLLDNLQQVEAALEKSAARADEQLGYYVEQAREVIELSMASQQEVIDALGALPASDGTRAGAN